MTEKERNIRSAMAFDDDGDIEIRRTRRIPTSGAPQSGVRQASVPQSGYRQASGPQGGSRQTSGTNQANYRPQGNTRLAGANIASRSASGTTQANSQPQGGYRQAGGTRQQSSGVRRQTSITPGAMRSADGGAARRSAQAQSSRSPAAGAAATGRGQGASQSRTAPAGAQTRTTANGTQTRTAPNGASRTLGAANAAGAPGRRGAQGAQSHTRKKPSSGRKRQNDKITAGCIVRRSLLSVGTALLLVVVIVFSVVLVVAHGPSPTARNKAVMSAMQASATKWVPKLFLSGETVDKIIADSKVVVTDVRSMEEAGVGEDAPPSVSEDRWQKAKDEGVILETFNGKTFKGYVLLIKDPSRVSVAIRDKNDWSRASRIFEIVEQYGALAAINGGEFPDNGVTTLANPIGLTYSGGECVWDDGYRRTFIGFTKDNKLFVEEGTLRARADELGIRDAVAFQTGNTLITNDGENITYYYADDNTGVAQRTAIGQLADGTVMFLVTDGRTAQSLGATKNDIIDTFIKYGAVTAGMLDGGSTAMLWYRDWYTKYGVDESNLDDWQRKGLVNIYKAFTNPRAIPSYFIVK